MTLHCRNSQVWQKVFACVLPFALHGLSLRVFAVAWLTYVVFWFWNTDSVCKPHTHTCPTTGSLHAPRDVLKLVGSLLALINRGRNWRAQWYQRIGFWIVLSRYLSKCTHSRTSQFYGKCCKRRALVIRFYPCNRLRCYCCSIAGVMFERHGLKLIIVIFRFHAGVLSIHGFVHDIFYVFRSFLLGMYIHISILFKIFGYGLIIANTWKHCVISLCS